MNLFFDDLDIGYRDRYGPYEVSKEEIIEFAKKYDPEAFHTDEMAGKKSIYGGLVASSSQLFPIAYALSHMCENRIVILAPLGIDEVTFPGPLRPGDKVYCEIEIVEKTASKSKPDRGIMKSHTVLKTSDDAAVLDYMHTLLVARKSVP